MTVADKTTAEMVRLFRSGLSMPQIGAAYGITRQAVQLRLAKVGIARDARPRLLPKYKLIDKKRLASLYAGERLAIDKIGAAFGVAGGVIYQALKFYKIPQRTSIKLDGKYANVLKKLKVGEAARVECANRKPYINLHQAAKRAGIKISVRKASEGDGSTFLVTRVDKKRAFREEKS